MAMTENCKLNVEPHPGEMHSNHALTGNFHLNCCEIQSARKEHDVNYSEALSVFSICKELIVWWNGLLKR